MYELSPSELKEVQDYEKEFAAENEAIIMAKSFNLGDYILRKIAVHNWKTGATDFDYVKNSHGLPHKFQVVYVDSNGLGWIKQLSNAGKPIGELISLYEEAGAYSSRLIKYELDPEYAEAIIMGMQDEYHPTAISKEKSQIAKEIAKHNATIKVKFTGIEDAEKFLSSLKVGDTVWGSNSRSYLVQEIETIAKPDRRTKTWHTWMGMHNHPTYTQVTLESRGAQVVWTPVDVWHKAIYTSQPRSYKETKI